MIPTLRPAPPPVPYTLDELRADVVRWSRKADWSIERYEIRRLQLVAMARDARTGRVDEGQLMTLKRDDIELREAGNQVTFRTAHVARLAATLANELKMRELGMVVGPQ